MSINQPDSFIHSEKRSSGTTVCETLFQGRANQLWTEKKKTKSAAVEPPVHAELPILYLSGKIHSLLGKIIRFLRWCALSLLLPLRWHAGVWAEGMCLYGLVTRGHVSYLLTSGLRYDILHLLNETVRKTSQHAMTWRCVSAVTETLQTWLAHRPTPGAPFTRTMMWKAPPAVAQCTACTLICGSPENSTKEEHVIQTWKLEETTYRVRTKPWPEVSWMKLQESE